MLALPTLQGVPFFKRASSSDALAAKLALAVAGREPIAAPRRRVQALEVDVLHAELHRWLGKLHEPMTLFTPALDVSVGRDDNRRPFSAEFAAILWLGVRQETIVGPVWHLEPRWKSLEKRQQGLAAWALSTIESAGRHSFPLYTPSTCEYFAEFCWWHCESDESIILEQYREEIGDPKAEAPADMITRAKFDAALPKFVQRPRPRLPVNRLEWLASLGGRNDLAEIARLVLQLRVEIKAAQKAKEPAMEHGNDDGLISCNYAAMVRWNGEDPMPQAFDDFTNEHAQCEGVDEAFGHFTAETPKDLPNVQRAIERRFRIAALVEQLLPLISERQ
jgi:PRTRC genetic system protein F